MREDPASLYKLSVGNSVFANEYDGLGRLKTKKTSHGETDIGTESYTYASNPANSLLTSTQVSKMTDLSGNAHTYTYDANGNILSDTYKGKTTSYEYDEQNRMTLYKDEAFGFAYEYTYDNRGNILEMKEYRLPNMTTPHNTFVYEYSDGTWSDLLTSYDGTEITYDELGNPQNWVLGEELTWENRRLTSVDDTEYKYNADGLRVSKENSRQSTEYYIVNGTYVGEVTEIGGQKFVITYLYGTDGIAGIDVNGSVYYFVKNLQGDVTGILDSNGNTVGTYEYEAYGVITAIKDAQGYNIMYGGNYETSVLQLNPFRYRGYMFDPESEFYYLNSRYYDPWTSRFLNPDAMVSTGQGFDGNNMFAYCLNNPVMYKDPAGNRSVEAIQNEIKRVEEQIKLVEWSMANGIGSYNTKYSCNLKRKLNNLNNELAVALNPIVVSPDKSMAEKGDFINAVYVRGVLNESITGIPAALMAAQAGWESGYGQSDYAIYKNNLFGLGTINFDSIDDCIVYYENLLSDPDGRYSCLHGKSLDEWIDGIGPAGYNTVNPSYGEDLRNMINMWGLN